MESKIKSLLYAYEASVELRVIIEELDYLGNMSQQVMNDINMSSKVTD